MLKRFAHYFKPHKKMFFLDLFCALIVAVCDLFYPMVAKDIINVYVPERNLRLLIVWSLVLLGIYLLKLGMNYIVAFFGHMVGVHIQADMRRDLFRHLEKLPFSYYDENKTGSIMSRLINDLFEVSELAHHGPEDLFLCIVMFIGSFIMLSTINIWLTLVVFAVLPFILYFAVRMRKSMSEAFRKSREQIAELNADIEASVSGMRVSRAYTAEAHEEKRFAEENVRYQAARELAYKAMGKFHSGMTFFTDFLYLVVLAAGGLFFFYGMIDTGEFAAYLLYISMFLSPIKRFVNFFEQLQEGMTGLGRFCEIMDIKPEEEAPDAKVLENPQGHIRFDNVSFSYSGEDQYFAKGDKTVQFSINGIPFSGFICYDLRFPEIFQAVSDHAHVIIVAADWPGSRRAHWKCLLQARAIENQCYILGINSVGDQNGQHYTGDSCVILPDGTVAEQLSDEEGLIYYELSDDVEDYRCAFPVRQDRRKDLYVKLYKEN